MLKVKFRFRSGHRDVSPAPPWRLRGLFLNLTEHCQLNCFYCHAHVERRSAAMPFEIVEKVLDEAVAFGAPAILLTGGEPFLYPRFEDVVRGCHERGLPCKLATNGGLIGPRGVEMLLRHGVRSLQVSLDTLDPELYASSRATSPRVHATVLDSVRRCVATGKLHVVVSSVAERRILPGLSELMRFCQHEGVDTFTLYHLVPYGRAAAASVDWLGEQEFVDVVDGLMATFSGLPGCRQVDLSVPWAEGSVVQRSWEQSLDIQPVGCIAGKTSMTVLADGEVVPCVCLEDRTFSCGNVRERSLAELWSAAPMRLFRGEAAIAACAGCSDYESCRGGCRALAYLTSRQPDGPDPACACWKVTARDAALANG